MSAPIHCPDSSDANQYDDLFDPEKLARLDPENIPQHVAVIMDGNRRWAKNYGLPAWVGHWRGAQNLRLITRAAERLGVKTLTTYVFSTENWSRAKKEVSTLMSVFKRYLVSERKRMLKDGVRLRHIGDTSRLPEGYVNLLRETEEMTAEGDRLNLILAINYGGRDEIRRACQRIAELAKNGLIEPEAITDKLIQSHLDTANWPDPELLIRTSGEMRISNFLLYQVSYSEMIMTPTLWPNFSPNDFLDSLLNYQSRNIRRGQ
jgi:undecaprenyl diphosphate synthase